MQVNIALMFPDDVAAGLLALSAEISEQTQSSIVLGESCLPHLSLVQTEIHNSELAQFRSLVDGSYAQPPAIDLAGVTLLPSKTGDIWVEIQVLKSRRLAALQHEFLSHPLFRSRRVVNGVGDAYRPHITLALIRGDHSSQMPLPYSVLRAQQVPTTLAIGSAGQHHTFARTL